MGDETLDKKAVENKKLTLSPSEVADKTGWSKEYVIERAPKIEGAYKNRSGWQIPAKWVKWNMRWEKLRWDKSTHKT